MVAIPGLTEITAAATGDDLVIETSGGTRRISRVNFQLRRSELALITPPNINLDADLLWMSDATDGLLKGIVFNDVIFGNYTNDQISDGFALDPAVHNIKPIELNGTFANSTITISDTTPDIGGASFNLFNFSTTDLTLSAIDAMVMHENGLVVASATIRENTAATLQVNDAGDEVIFAGG